MQLQPVSRTDLVAVAIAIYQIEINSLVRTFATDNLPIFISILQVFHPRNINVIATRKLRHLPVAASFFPSLSLNQQSIEYSAE